MSLRDLKGNQTLLRVYVHENAKFHHKHLWELLLKNGREFGLAGCTVLRDYEGFGPHHKFHSFMMMEGAGIFTYVLEFVDTDEHIENFLNTSDELLKEVLVTKENVTVRHYTFKDNNEPAKEIAEGKMATNEMNGKQTLLRIFLGETDKTGHHLVYGEILNQARKSGIAGMTVLRGVAGFGASSIIHEPHLFRLSDDLPVVIEVVDSKTKLDSFLKQIEPMLTGTLVTEEEVEVRHYKGK